MEIGQYLKVKLHFALNAIEMLVEVVWIDLHMVMDQGDYRCGVRFVDISPEDLNKLKDFLRSLMD
jgi:hypothetical protein